MSVTFISADPKSLLKDFEDRIAQSEPKGKITTWEKTANGNYTHKAADWHGKASFKPSVETGKLVFYIIKPATENVAVTTYGYYHGHLIETFLNHFDQKFTDGTASALPRTGDVVK